MLSKMLLLISVCIYFLITTSEASSATYTRDADIHLESGAALLNDHPATSPRHCAQLCTADPSCAAATYDADDALCKLLASPTVWTTRKSGSIGILPQFKVPGKF